MICASWAETISGAVGSGKPIGLAADLDIGSSANWLDWFPAYHNLGTLVM